MAKRKRTSKSKLPVKKVIQPRSDGKQFLDLPPEIRNVIYDLVLADRDLSRWVPRYPNLLFVNQQIYSELAPLAIRSRRTVLGINMQEKHDRSSELHRQLTKVCRTMRPETAAFFTELALEESAPYSYLDDDEWPDVGRFWDKELNFFDIGRVACLLSDFTNLVTFRWGVNLSRTVSMAFAWNRTKRFKQTM